MTPKINTQQIKEQTGIELSDEEVNDYLKIVSIRHIRKKQFIVQPGFPSQYHHYVVQGAFRAFVINSEGNEDTFQFAIEDWYINDISSYLNGTPSEMYIEALEDSVIQEIPKKEFELLCDKYPNFQKVYRLAAQRGFAYAQKRMISNLKNSALERYLDFRKNYRQIENRVPQFALASYLNMSQEYLSKVKSKVHKLKL